MATPGTKEKRRNSEKRKEKSRDAARCRRSKESEIFADLAQALPLASGLTTHLDKASVMRLTIAYLKTKTLLDYTASPGLENEITSTGRKRALDSLLLKSLEGFLLALSPEGDIVYVTENVSQHLGLPQIDLIGQSIYDYSHQCDQPELRAILELKTEVGGSRSFFLRLKCTLTNKGRSVNLKSASYKVIHCMGRIVRSAVSGAESPSAERIGTASPGNPDYFLVLIGEPIPHPSNIEVPLDSHTFLTKHTMDMKYTYVDDKISEFLGYSPEELEGKSAYEFHHNLDNDVIWKSFNALKGKGQIQTPSYRFLARQGGYAWVQTQATVVYGSRDNRAQAVVCVHMVLSGIEEEDQVFTAAQAAASAIAPYNVSLKSTPKSTDTRNRVIETQVMENVLPQTTTSKHFVPRTADMNSGFITFDKEGKKVLKEEPEDLTHLAPTAGDVCIPLDMPTDFTSLDDVLNECSLPLGSLDCFPLTALEFPGFNPEADLAVVLGAAADEECEKDSVQSATASTFKEDPFLFMNNDKVSVASGLSYCKFERECPRSSLTDLLSPVSSKNYDGCEEYMHDFENPVEEATLSPLEIPTPALTRSNSVDSTISVNPEDGDDTCFHKKNVVSGEGLKLLMRSTSHIRKSRQMESSDEEEDFETRAPYIPMGDADDLPLFDCNAFMYDTSFESCETIYPNPFPEDIKFSAESNLAKLLRSPPPRCVPPPAVLNNVQDGLGSSEVQRRYNVKVGDYFLLPREDTEGSRTKKCDFDGARGMKRGFSPMQEIQSEKRLKGQSSVTLASLLAQPQQLKSNSKPFIEAPSHKPKPAMTGGGLVEEESAFRQSSGSGRFNSLNTKASVTMTGGTMEEAWKERPASAIKSFPLLTSCTSKANVVRHEIEQPNSVLLNLLVSGHDRQTGYSVPKDRGEIKTQNLSKSGLGSPISLPSVSLSPTSDKDAAASLKHVRQQDSYPHVIRKCEPESLCFGPNSGLQSVFNLDLYEYEADSSVSSASNLLQNQELLLELPSDFETD